MSADRSWRRSPGKSPRVVALAIVVAQLAAACSAPVLANPPITFPSPPRPSATRSAPPDPIAIAFPRDDGPHDRLTEWWYYTGHLRTSDGRRFGFEAVVFRAERGSVPTTWAAHLALTQEATELLQQPAFFYAQRSEVGVQVDHSPRDHAGLPTGFDLQVAGLSPTLIANGAPAVAPPWRLAGGGGTDQIEAVLTDEEAGIAGVPFGLHLNLDATKEPALHDGDGFVGFGPAGGSYYYSRTRMTATGTLDLRGEQLSVDGIAWFDHQWGDFVSVGAGGWDWFAINLDDGTDLTLSLVRGAQGNAVSGDAVLQYGTLVDSEGGVSHLTNADFTLEPLGSWQSARSGHTYAAGWRISLPAVLPFGEATIELRPTVVDQELDTRATTGVAYWEGSQNVLVIRPTIVGAPGGEAYVEMTRYSP